MWVAHQDLGARVSGGGGGCGGTHGRAARRGVKSGVMAQVAGNCDAPSWEGVRLERTEPSVAVLCMLVSE